MVIPRLMKRLTSNKRGCTNNNVPSDVSTAIKSLPKDLLLEVVAKVASNSFTDLFNVKKSCRDFLDVAEDKYILQHVSLDRFPLIPRFRNDKESLFLKRCKESGNIEILYREGLKEFFGHNSKEQTNGLENLKIATQKGHREAKYVYGMISLSSEHEESRQEGLEHLRFLRRSKCVVTCRKKVEKLLNGIWKNNKVLMRNQKPRYHSKNTCKGWRVRNPWRWPLQDDEDDDTSDVNLCEYCRWDHELELFYEICNIH